jgi:hypothetical protein
VKAACRRDGLFAEPPASRPACPRLAIEFMIDLTDETEPCFPPYLFRNPLKCPSRAPRRPCPALPCSTSPGPFRADCVRQLADWGVNVVKIDALLEDAAGEQPGGPRQGSDFQNLRRNKHAMRGPDRMLGRDLIEAGLNEGAAAAMQRKELQGKALVGTPCLATSSNAATAASFNPKSNRPIVIPL